MGGHSKRIMFKDFDGLLLDLRVLTQIQYFPRQINGYCTISIKNSGGAYVEKFSGSLRECWAWSIGALTLTREVQSNGQV